jgi:hypothetical protein
MKSLLPALAFAFLLSSPVHASDASDDIFNEQSLDACSKQLGFADVQEMFTAMEQNQGAASQNFGDCLTKKEKELHPELAELIDQRNTKIEALGCTPENLAECGEKYKDIIAWYNAEAAKKQKGE